VQFNESTNFSEEHVACIFGLKKAKKETKMKQTANKALPGLFFSFGDEHNTFI
jgi:hypothetical protein